MSANPSTLGLRPPQVAKAKKPKDDGDSSDEELKKMIERNKNYMTHYKETSAVAHQTSFRPNRGARPGMNKNPILPAGYTCHRCRQKGHLISDCPTNGNPDFDLK